MRPDELDQLVRSGQVVELELYPVESPDRSGYSWNQIIEAKQDKDLGWIFELRTPQGREWSLWRAFRTPTRVRSQGVTTSIDA